MLGANVIAGTGAEERVEVAKSYGADFGVNYRRQNLAEEITRLTDGRGVDVVCENIADPTLWPGAFNSLAMGGRLVTAGAHGGGEVKLDVKRLYMRRLRGQDPRDHRPHDATARSGGGPSHRRKKSDLGENHFRSDSILKTGNI
jgi:NADPH:quinone reductase-like Zn-dependent oxidoreductase